MKYKLINDLKKNTNVAIEGWVARDANGALFLYTAKPIRSLETRSWVICEKENLCIISNSLFPELTWEDEPIEVSITYKK